MIQKLLLRQFPSYPPHFLVSTASLPCIYLVDSGGAFLPKQDEVFPDRSVERILLHSLLATHTFYGAKGSRCNPIRGSWSMVLSTNTCTHPLQSCVCFTVNILGEFSSTR